MRPFLHLLLILTLVLGLVTMAPWYTQLHILPGSSLAINGTSNVTDFSCCCEENFAPLNYQFAALEDRQLLLENTRLRIPVQMLDCGNRIMNKDMRRALRAADHPYIDIEPQSIHLRQATTSPIGQWIQVEASTEVSIAGTTKTVALQATARRLTDKRWQIKSNKKLLMNDFGIEPPTAMGGLIKVKDEISIHFDLLVESR